MNDYSNKVLVTIAIPAYKRRWLNEAIESALSQDYQNIELLIIDDHSPQNLKEVVEPYLSDSRVKYFYNKKNLGKRSIVHNWNRCLELAQGEFFVLLCDDDVLEPNFVSVLLALANKYLQCNVFHARKKELMWDGSVKIDSVWPEYEIGIEFVNNYFQGKRYHTIGEFMYRTSSIRREKYKVFPAGYYSDDASLLLFVENGGIASTQVPLYVFRYSDNHISSSNAYNLGKIKAMHRYYKWVRRHYPNATGYIERKEQEYKSSINYFFSATEIQKLLILPYIPFSKSNCKVIARYYINRFCLGRQSRVS